MRPLIRLAAALALTTGLFSCSLFDYSNIVTQKYALVYGVTRYTMGVGPASSPNLQYPDADAKSMATLLAAEGYNVTSRWIDGGGYVWTNGASALGASSQIGALQTSFADGSNPIGENGSLAALPPTKQQIISDINALSAAIGSNDILVIYFSGHGTQDTSTSPPREYFDPYGGVMRYTGDGKFYDFPVPSVRDDDLRQAFDAIKTPRKVLILDTCNSGGFIGNQLEADWTAPSSVMAPTFVGPGTLFEAISNYASMQSSPTGLSPYGAQVISAAGRDELSYETSDYGHGVMTYWLLRGLQGKTADLNNDGHVTVLEAFAYAKAGVDENWNAANPVASDGTSAKFEPRVSGGPVDFVLF